jgi:hypothetical protein
LAVFWRNASIADGLVLVNHSDSVMRSFSSPRCRSTERRDGLLWAIMGGGGTRSNRMTRKEDPMTHCVRIRLAVLAVTAFLP